MALRVTEQELRDLLVSRLEVIDAAEFDRARIMAARLRLPLEQVLVERGRVPFGFLLEQLADVWGVGFIDLKVSDVNPDALRVIPEDYARAQTLIPFDLQADRLQVAMWDPRDHKVIGEIQGMSKLRVAPHLASAQAIRRTQLLYRGDLRELLERSAEETVLTVQRSQRPADDRGATDLVTRVLEYAAVTRASDIHVEPFEFESLVRCRVDGVLQEVLSLPQVAHAPIVSRLKILAGMRIDERRTAQDGRFEADLSGLKLDLRISSVPTLWGEKVVMRVLTKEVAAVDLEDLGLVSTDFQIVSRNILRPFGMVLITGPTGSGKSTTLYAMLMRLGAERQNLVNISTIEDPVEYTIPRVNQIPVNLAAGVEFATGLRALLRQDPDVIMVGEIRDRDTAEIAVRSALVGRLLFSTLHTNDSTGAIPRLLDMGIEPFLVASTLTLVLGQRLARRICVGCRESAVPDPLVVKLIRSRADFEGTVQVLRAQGALGAGADPLAGIRWFRGKGCRQCGGRGFRGRLGVFELFEVDDEIRGMIMDRQPATTIRAAAVTKGMKTMFQDGLAKVFLGETTIEEVLRIAL